jgi:hypothetical protein
MTVYLDSVITEYYNGSAWVDITNYVVGDIKGNNGLGGWRPENRVAVLGTLNITLNNKGKLFSPMGGDAVRGLTTLTGFNKGAKIRIRGPFRTRNDVIWTGRIISINSDDLNWGNEQVRLMAADWMSVPVNYPMAGATIALNQKIDQAMTLILARLSQQPEATDFDIGTNIFPAVFDNVQRKTMALSEFTKLANSELGYIYPKQDGTLVAENMLARTGVRALDQVWVQPDTDAFLLMEDGNFLLLETGGRIILDEGVLENAAIASDAEGYSILLGEGDLLNASIIRAHPVVTDTSLKVLYSLGTPLFIPEGQTVTFSAHYTDPSGLSQVSGTNMQAPEATTDYLANTTKGGGGTNKTGDQVVTATYYGDIVYYSIFNNANQGVWLNFLQARGYGIYYGNSIESTIEDATSQSAYGYAPFQFDMRYQKDTYLANMYGLSVIEEYKNPKSRIISMKYLANLNRNHMMSFLMLTIGSLILGTEDRSGISNHYYITDRDFTIKQGGIINIEYGVKQNDSYLSGGLLPLTVRFYGSGSKDAINYGYLPHVSNISQRSFSFWVYPKESDSTLIGYGLEYRIIIQGANPYIRVAQNHSTTIGLWDTPNNSMKLGEWNHVVITHDTSLSSVAAPLVYVNGVLKAITVSSTPVGTVADETGTEFVLANSHSSIFDYVEPLDGKLFDPRVYNRILTAAEAVTLYNAGVANESLVTSGIVFQGLAIYADQAGDFQEGHILTSDERLVDNALRTVGMPNGSPRIVPMYINNVLHMNGADASNTFTDIVGVVWTAHGNAQIDTAQYKFGGASAIFDGTGDYIDTPDDADFTFGSVDFTVDLWVKYGGGLFYLFGQGPYAASYPPNFSLSSVFAMINSSIFSVNFVNGSTVWTASKPATLNDNNWHHLAMIRHGNNLYAAVDGVFGVARDITGLSANDSANKFSIGSLGEYVASFGFTGWIDEFRVTKKALWTADFTPPTVEY